MKRYIVICFCAAAFIFQALSGGDSYAEWSESTGKRLSRMLADDDIAIRRTALKELSGYDNAGAAGLLLKSVAYFDVECRKYEKEFDKTRSRFMRSVKGMGGVNATQMFRTLDLQKLWGERRYLWLESWTCSTGRPKRPTHSARSFS